MAHPGHIEDGQGSERQRQDDEHAEPAADLDPEFEILQHISSKGQDVPEFPPTRPRGILCHPLPDYRRVPLFLSLHTPWVLGK